jgi:hypothetical protein
MWLFSAALAVTAIAPIASAQSDAQNEILLGMSTALSGPAADLGLNVRAGVLAALEEANRDGGVHGLKLRLINLDDGYEPAGTAGNMRRLVDEEKVLVVIGNVGTPTAVVAVPIANSRKTLFFGAVTGAGVLRKTPPDWPAPSSSSPLASESRGPSAARSTPSRVPGWNWRRRTNKLRMPAGRKAHSWPT